jgi:DNA-binding NarL/FixJ family response regulator
MFKNVLIAEDHESANISVQKTLQDLGIGKVDYAHYCDDALGKIQKGLRNAQPYELLITDLSFEEDGYRQKLDGGAALIAAARQVQPELKVLVFSAENKEAVIRELYQKLSINGYVRKARRDAQELRTAIETIYKNKQHLPLEFRQAIRQKNAHDFTPYDITIISQLAKGMFLKEIPAYMQQQRIKPSSLSSIEKRLNQIKEVLDFSKNEQLVAFCKDKGII